MFRYTGEGGGAWPATSGPAEAQRASPAGRIAGRRPAARRRRGTPWASAAAADARAQGKRSFRTKVRVPNRKGTKRATLVVSFYDSAGRLVTRVRKRVRDNGTRDDQRVGRGPGRALPVHRAPRRPRKILRRGSFGVKSSRARAGIRSDQALVCQILQAEAADSAAGTRAASVPRPMALARRAWPDALAALVVAAAVFAFFGHAFLNYDSFYALVWGDDLAHGRTPQYDAPVAPTPHPLATLVGLLLSPLGDHAETAFLVIVIVSIGALAVGIFRLGQELFSTAGRRAGRGRSSSRACRCSTSASAATSTCRRSRWSCGRRCSRRARRGAARR